MSNSIEKSLYVEGDSFVPENNETENKEEETYAATCNTPVYRETIEYHETESGALYEIERYDRKVNWAEVLTKANSFKNIIGDEVLDGYYFVACDDQFLVFDTKETADHFANIFTNSSRDKVIYRGTTSVYESDKLHTCMDSLEISTYRVRYHCKWFTKWNKII
jgi:hypothetical protein